MAAISGGQQAGFVNRQRLNFNASLNHQKLSAPRLFIKPTLFLGNLADCSDRPSSVRARRTLRNVPKEQGIIAGIIKNLTSDLV
jgi:hypothetical protein